MEVGEKTLQPDEWGAEFYSSLAHSGSAVWEEKGGADARSKFWLWYLDKAVPHAWNVEVPWRSLTKPV